MKNYLPDIYYFNPTCEYAVANGHTSWQPNLLLQKMEEDLGTLPLFFAAPDDVVLVKKMPSPDYIKRLREAGIHLPQFIGIDQLKNNKQFINTPRNKLRPWGWSPAVHRLLDPLKGSCSDSFKESPVAGWKDEYRDLYSRKFALEVLHQVLPLLPQELILSPDQHPQVCTTRDEIETLINRWGKIMVKAPWSSSGRGLQRVTKLPVVEKVWDKLLGIINEQGYAVVEPYLGKLLDMALQFRLEEGKVSFVGISRFFTNDKGQYQGNYLNGWPADIDRQITMFADKMSELLIPHLTRVLENSKLASSYEGNFGIDTLIFRDESGKLKINPCLEINVRQNMGLLSLQLEKLLAPGRKGIFGMYFRKGKDFKTYADIVQTSAPIEFREGKIDSGFLPLTPTDTDTLFGAWIMAGDQRSLNLF